MKLLRKKNSSLLIVITLFIIMLNDKYGLLEDEHIALFEELLRNYGTGVVLDLVVV